jgi:hypothetical protein
MKRVRMLLLVLISASFLTNFDCNLGGGGGKQGGGCSQGLVCCQTWDHGIDPTGNPSSAEYSCQSHSQCSLIGGTPVSGGLCH